MLPGMAGANLSDDVALCSAAIAGLARLLITRGLLRPHEFTAVADRAGLSEAQAGQFTRGEVLLPPHQCLTLVVAAFERMRTMEVSAAELRTAQTAVPVPAETTLAGAQAAVDKLAKNFPDWQFPLPDGAEVEGDRRKLTWRARHPENNLDRTGATEAELRGKVTLLDAGFKAEAEQLARYHDGRGISRR
jgi:DNA-binding transcriptional regulator YdaS (Cro superfamily)